MVALVTRGAGARLGEIEAAAYLAYDIIQLGVLLFLTGGLENPFAILAIAPVTVAATVLSRRSVIALWLMTVTTISITSVRRSTAKSTPMLSIPDWIQVK
jgi:two-component system sensor histidine kinase RegB